MITYAATRIKTLSQQELVRLLKAPSLIETVVSDYKGK